MTLKYMSVKWYV